jgi:hypothetical protein
MDTKVIPQEAQGMPKKRNHKSTTLDNQYLM